MVTQHAYSLAATVDENAYENCVVYCTNKLNLLLAVWISHVTVWAIDGDAAITSSQVCANIVAVTTNSRRVFAFIDILNRISTGVRHILDKQ